MHAPLCVQRIHISNRWRTFLTSGASEARQTFAVALYSPTSGPIHAVTELCAVLPPVSKRAHVMTRGTCNKVVPYFNNNACFVSTQRHANTWPTFHLQGKVYRSRKQINKRNSNKSEQEVFVKMLSPCCPAHYMSHGLGRVLKGQLMSYQCARTNNYVQLWNMYRILHRKTGNVKTHWRKVRPKHYRGGVEKTKTKNMDNALTKQCH